MDSELVRGIRKGDVEAFDKLFEKYANRLYAFSLKYLRSKEDAEEVVQNVFLKVWEKRKTLKSQTSFKSYLFTLVYNDICNVFRKRRYHQKFKVGFHHKDIATGTDTHEVIDFKSTLNQINELISELPEIQKKVFVKSKQEGLSSKRIAEELNISSRTVDNYISLTVKFLRAKLGNEIFCLFLFVYIVL